MTLRTSLTRILGALVLILTGGLATAQDSYRLGVSDVVRIKVVEWLAADGGFRDWSAIAGEYVVGPTGQLAVPLLGEVPAGGLSTAELATGVSEGLRQVLALPGAPSVTVEVARFGPVYVTGSVRTPGEYPFSPGLTVIKAMSLAGGERLGDLLTDRDLVSTQGEVQVLRQKQLRLIAKRARLDAELGGLTEIPIPPDLEGIGTAADLVAVEQAILVADRRKATRQQSTLDDLVALLNTELATLDRKHATVSRQLELARADLDDVKSLADDGLAVNSRVSALEQNVATLEGSLLDIETAMLRARQDISDATRDSVGLADSRRADVTLARQQADAEIAEIALRLTTQQTLLGEIGAGVTDAGMALTYSYTIIRGAEEISADEHTAVAPGDVIKVAPILPL